MENQKSLLKFQIFSAIFTLILGTLLHFAFEFFNNNLLVASFSSVNESVWEHLKLLFFPMLLTTIIGWFYLGKSFPKFLCAKTVSIFISLFFIIVFFYTYTGIIGTNFAFLNIGSFIIAVLLSEYITYKLLYSNFLCNKKFSIIFLVLLLLCFIVFTYFPPKIGLFEDPITGGFGIVNYSL